MINYTGNDREEMSGFLVKISDKIDFSESRYRKGGEDMDRYGNNIIMAMIYNEQFHMMSDMLSHLSTLEYKPKIHEVVDFKGKNIFHAMTFSFAPPILLTKLLQYVCDSSDKDSLMNKLTEKAIFSIDGEKIELSAIDLFVSTGRAEELKQFDLGDLKQNITLVPTKKLEKIFEESGGCNYWDQHCYSDSKTLFKRVVGTDWRLYNKQILDQIDLLVARNNMKDKAFYARKIKRYEKSRKI